MGIPPFMGPVGGVTPLTTGSTYIVMKTAGAFSNLT